MSDFQMTLRYMTVSALKRVSLGWVTDPEDRDTPGWFIEAHRNEGHERVVKLTRVRSADALHLAHVLDGILGTPANTPGLARAVTVLNADHEQALCHLRKRAEQQMVECGHMIQRINEALGDR